MTPTPSEARQVAELEMLRSHEADRLRWAQGTAKSAPLRLRIEALDAAIRALRQGGEAVACYGIRRKGSTAIIGVVPEKIHRRPPTSPEYARDYEEVPLYALPTPPAQEHPND